jgi:hypothetical protein
VDASLAGLRRTQLREVCIVRYHVAADTVGRFCPVGV